MEEASTAAKAFHSLWDQLIHAPSHLLLLIVLIVIGILIKKSPTPNWLIPWILITIGAVGYPLLASPGHIDPSFPNPDIVLRIYGGLLGVGAIIAHIFLRKMEWFRNIENGIVNAFRQEEDKLVVTSTPTGKPLEIDPNKST